MSHVTGILFRALTFKSTSQVNGSKVKFVKAIFSHKGIFSVLQHPNDIKFHTQNGPIYSGNFFNSLFACVLRNTRKSRNSSETCR